MESDDLKELVGELRKIRVLMERSFFKGCIHKHHLKRYLPLLERIYRDGSGIPLPEELAD